MKKQQKWNEKLKQVFSASVRWLSPGIGVKRWLLLILIGITLLVIGVGVFMLDSFRAAGNTFWLQIFSIISLRFLNTTLRAFVFGFSGLILIGIGTFGLNRSLLKPFIKPGEPILDTISLFRKREKGPRIVAIGGGTGLSTLLRGLKDYSHNLTAIVTVADDGGSSGELRKNLGILPPGDIRSCLAALSDDEELMTKVFQYRFGESAGINGHALGNLLISALTDITGSFEEAVAESGRVLAVRGRVLPATLHDVKLVAEIRLPNQTSEVKVIGESQIPKTLGIIRRLWLEPSNPLPFPPTIQAILAADLIIIGPGSLYTSLLPNLLVPDLADAIKASRAVKFYICNVANQKGETDGYKVLDHIHAIEKHLHDQPIDVIICNNDFNPKLPAGVEWVMPDVDLEEQYSIYFAALVEKENPWRHDSQLLAQTVINLFLERTGPLGNRQIAKE